MKYDIGTVIVVGVCCAAAFAFGGPIGIMICGLILMFSQKKS